ncbi:hypothetical protein DL98DRAFT_429329 [Cadophora sp. DSE1049]|nr:hypothetical protein DL98DRAFT_429329 [Cadophora sp. DSE1049]
MVGVPTKNRCANCRIRKKKALPSCTACVNSGWPCPGYNTPWKFVDETQQLAKHYAARKYVYDVIDLELEDAYRKELESSDSDKFSSLDSYQSYHPKSLIARFTIDIPRHLESNPLGKELVFCMGSKVQGTLIPLPLVGSFFKFIPSRLGQNLALDDAVSCLCSIYLGPPSPSYAYHQRDIFQMYSRALGSLRECLGDQRRLEAAYSSTCS